MSDEWRRVVKCMHSGRQAAGPREGNCSEKNHLVERFLILVSHKDISDWQDSIGKDKINTG